MNLQQTIKKILREETEIPSTMRRRMNELPKYMRGTYRWLNVNSFDSFDEFVKRVVFSTTRDFVGDFGTDDYDKNSKIKSLLTPYVSKLIYDEYLDEIKDYYEKELLR